MQRGLTQHSCMDSDAEDIPDEAPTRKSNRRAKKTQGKTIYDDDTLFMKPRIKRVGRKTVEE